MAWTNYHTHSKFCDGVGELEDFVIEAIKQKVEVLGFSSHAPLPFDAYWTMKPELLESYCDNVLALKQKYKDRIIIKLGLEIDYIPGVNGSKSDRFKNIGLDYCIGSVHFMGKLDNGVDWTADATPEELLQGINETFGGSVRKAVEHYYSLVASMAGEGGFDIVGHIDLITKYNKGNRFFNETEYWYMKAVEKALLAVKKADVIVEVNTGGMSRGYTDSPYPSKAILARCLELGIPVTLNSDVHFAQYMTYYFPEALKMLVDIGYREIYTLRDDKWMPEAIP